MRYITRATSLYQFLWHCNASSLPKTVLDCGAAGPHPPLVIFRQNGYETRGIDNSLNRIAQSQAFEQEHQMALNIQYGDMRDLDFEDGEFSFLYSYNSIFHLTKPDTALAIGEFKRVVRPGGLFYVDFLSVEDGLYGQGESIGSHQFVLECRGESTLRSFYGDDEADELFRGCRILRKEKRLVGRFHHDEWIQQAFVDYIAQVRK